MKNERSSGAATVRIYEDDAYCKDFTAKVISCSQVSDGYAIELNQTAFFPEGGGQDSDSGYIDDIRVTQVRCEDGRILHYTDKPIAEGTIALLRIDWGKRFSNMQNHTGEHLVSGLIDKFWGFRNVGFRLGEDVVTVDVDGVLSEEDIEKIVVEANRAVYANVPVDCRVYTKDEADKKYYRSKIDFEEDIRLVTIEGYDCCACCAPHVARTGEIGLIQILTWEAHRGGTRLTMICGERAVHDAIHKQKSVRAISALLSAKPEDTAEAVSALLQRFEERKEENNALKRELSEIRLRMFMETQKHNPVTNVCFFEANFDEIQMRTVLNGAVTVCDGFVCGFIGLSGQGYRYIVASQKEDARELSKAMNEAFNGRGGGSARMTQGSLTANQADIEQFVRAFGRESQTNE